MDATSNLDVTTTLQHFEWMVCVAVVKIWGAQFHCSALVAVFEKDRQRQEKGHSINTMTATRPENPHFRRRLQESAACVCDEVASQNPDAPSRAAVQSEISSINWAAFGQSTICSLPVNPVVDCPRNAAEMEIAENIPISFWVSRDDGACLTLADVTLLAETFVQEYNAIKGDGRFFPCQPEYVQISSVTFDPNIVAGCPARRQLSNGRWLRDGINVELDFTANSNTGTNLAQIANVDNVVEVARTNVNIKTGFTALTEGSPSPSSVPSKFPSSFPSSFPSAFPSSFPSEFPTSKPSESPSLFPPCSLQSQSCFGIAADVWAWCASFVATADQCCIGTNACLWLDQATVTIFRGSCTDEQACDFAGSLATIIVGSNSCTDYGLAVALVQPGQPPSL